MARKTCPSCGAPFNGKKCRSCMYESFTEEFAHGNHTHAGEPLVIDAPTRAPIPRQDPFRCPPTPQKSAPKQPRKTASVELDTKKTKRGPARIRLLLFVAVVLVSLLKNADIPRMLRNLPIPSKPAATEPAASLPESWILYQDERYIVRTNWVNGSGDLENVQFLLENKTDGEVCMIMNEPVINGYFFNTYPLYCEAEAKSTGLGSFWLDSSELEKAGIDTIQELSFRLQILDTETYEIALEIPQRFTLQGDAPDGFVQGADDHGLVMLDQDGVRFISRGYVPSSYRPEKVSSGTLDFFLENNREEALTLFSRSLTVNGKELPDSLYAVIPAHTRSILSVHLTDAEALGISSPEQLTDASVTIDVLGPDSTYLFCIRGSVLPAD